MNDGNTMNFESREGQRVPAVTFRTRTSTDWRDVSSAELFDERTVVVFALPGAFTPTCSSTHLPRYEELATEFEAAGVDEVICISVNDAFVMNAWGKAQGINRVRMLPDGNAAFTREMGLLVDKSDLGFGERTWRYSMLVKNGVIEKMFIEPNEPGDPFTVSDADTMLSYLAPNARPAAGVAIFTRPGCAHCDRAKAMLGERDITFEEIVLGEAVTTRALHAIADASSTPQIFVDGTQIGGADELASWLESSGSRAA